MLKGTLLKEFLLTSSNSIYVHLKWDICTWHYSLDQKVGPHGFMEPFAILTCASHPSFPRYVALRTGITAMWDSTLDHLNKMQAKVWMPLFIAPESQAVAITPESRVCNHHSPVMLSCFLLRHKFFSQWGPVGPGSSLPSTMEHGKNGYFCNSDEMDFHLEWNLN